MATRSKVTPLNSVTRSGGSSEAVAEPHSENMEPIEWVRFAFDHWKTLGYQMKDQEFALYTQMFILCAQRNGVLEKNLESVARELPGGRRQVSKMVSRIKSLVRDYPDLFINTETDFAVKHARIEAKRAISKKNAGRTNANARWEKERGQSLAQRNQGCDDASA